MSVGDPPPGMLFSDVFGWFWPDECHCTYPMIKCDHTGCRCTVCGCLEKIKFKINKLNKKEGS